jgi:hypothetical protein
LNRRRLAGSGFANPSDIYAMEVEAADVECDWGLMTVPLWDLSIKEAIKRCEEYYERFWINEKDIYPYHTSEFAKIRRPYNRQERSYYSKRNIILLVE